MLGAAWYAALLGMQTQYDHTSDDGQMRHICLIERSSSLVLCLWTSRPPYGRHRPKKRADTDRVIGAHWLVRWRLQKGHEFRKRGRVLEQEQVPTFVPA